MFNCYAETESVYSDALLASGPVVGAGGDNQHM